MSSTISILLYRLVFSCIVLILCLTLRVASSATTSRGVISSPEPAIIPWSQRFPSPIRRWSSPTLGQDSYGCGQVVATPCQSILGALESARNTSSSIAQLRDGGIEITLMTGIYVGPSNRDLDFHLASVRLTAQHTSLLSPIRPQATRMSGYDEVIIDGELYGSPFIRFDSTMMSPALTAADPFAVSSIEGITVQHFLGPRAGAVYIVGNEINLGNQFSFIDVYFVDNYQKYAGVPAMGFFGVPTSAGTIFLQGAVVPGSIDSHHSNALFQSSLANPAASVTTSTHVPIFRQQELQTPQTDAPFVPAVRFLRCEIDRGAALLPELQFRGFFPLPFGLFHAVASVSSYSEWTECWVHNHTDSNLQAAQVSSQQFGILGGMATLFRRSIIEESLIDSFSVNFADSAIFAPTAPSHSLAFVDTILARHGQVKQVAPWGLIGLGSNNNLTIVNSVIENTGVSALYGYFGSSNIRVFDTIFRNNDLRNNNVESSLIAFFAFAALPPWMFVRTSFVNNSVGISRASGAGVILSQLTQAHQMHFEGCLFDGNIAPTSAGVIDMTNAFTGARVFIRGSTFRRNYASFGGAIRIFTTSAIVTIRNSTFDGNLALQEGGAIWCSAGNTLLESVIFENNQAGTGGALRVGQGAGDSILQIYNTSFIRNGANQGGAISVSTGSVGKLYDCRFVGNSALTYGGALYESPSPSLTYVRAVFQENRAGRSGGALYLPPILPSAVEVPAVLAAVASATTDCSSLFIDSVTFERNEATLLGGAMQFDTPLPSCTKFCGSDFANASVKIGNRTSVGPDTLEPASSTFGRCNFDQNRADLTYGNDFGFGVVDYTLEKVDDGINPSRSLEGEPTQGSASIGLVVPLGFPLISEIEAVVFPGLPFDLHLFAFDFYGRLFSVSGTGAVGMSMTVFLDSESTNQTVASFRTSEGRSAASVVMIKGRFPLTGLTLFARPGSIVHLLFTPEHAYLGAHRLQVKMGECSSAEGFMEPVNGAEMRDEEFRCVPMPIPFTISSTVRIVVFTAGAIAILLVLLCTVLVFAFWNTSVIRAASRPFLLLVLGFLAILALGSLLYAAIPTPFTSNGDFVCIARAWCSAFGISGVLATLLVKNWRVYKIFTDKKLQVRATSDWDLAITVAVVQGAMTIALIVFSSMPLSKPEFYSKSTSSDTQSLITQCSNEDGFFGWIGAVLAFLGLLMAATSALAFKARNLPSQFNESSHLTFALIVLILVGFIIVPLDILVSDNPNSGVLIQGVAQAIVCIILTITIFGPKAFYSMIQLRPDQNSILPGGNTTNAGESTLPSGKHQSSSIDRPMLPPQQTSMRNSTNRASFVQSPHTSQPGETRGSNTKLNPGQVGARVPPTPVSRKPLPQVFNPAAVSPPEKGNIATPTGSPRDDTIANPLTFESSPITIQPNSTSPAMIDVVVASESTPPVTSRADLVLDSRPAPDRIASPTTNGAIQSPRRVIRVHYGADRVEMTQTHNNNV